MKTLLTILILAITLPAQAADFWVHRTGKVVTAQQYDDMKSYGKEWDAFWVNCSEKVIAQAQKEGGAIILKRWGRNKVWAGRFVGVAGQGGGFVGPYLATGYYTSKPTWQLVDFSRPVLD